MNIEILKKIIERNEARRKFPYQDIKGKWTIGIGRNLSDRGLSDDEIDYLFSHDIQDSILNAKNIFPKFDIYSENRQIAITDMIFNMGASIFLTFQKTISHIRLEQWKEAGEQIKQSQYYIQVTSRANANIERIIKG